MTGNDLIAYIDTYNLQNEDIVGLSTEPNGIYFTAKRSSYNLVQVLYLDDSSVGTLIAYDERQIRSILSWCGLLDKQNIDNVINQCRKDSQHD